ncbi:hypothetical protein NM432_18280 (plasmid) [Vibrio metschnikovii]
MSNRWGPLLNTQPSTPPVKPKVTQHKLDDLKKGDSCPECQKGKLYKYEPATLLRITGQSPFRPRATRYGAATL